MLKEYKQQINEALSRKYYIEIAKIFNECKKVPSNQHRSFIMLRMMEMLKKDNPSFDVGRFMKASGGTEEGK